WRLRQSRRGSLCGGPAPGAAKDKVTARGPRSVSAAAAPSCEVAMFSSVAPLARHNPFYAPHFQLVQDGVRKRPAEPAEAPATRRLAAASANEGESGTEGPVEARPEGLRGWPCLRCCRHSGLCPPGRRRECQCSAGLGRAGRGRRWA
ncbi:hypothetical protein Nmel_005794, partial [Mimus melanotis]